MSKIVIGDIHGSIETLYALLEKLPHDDVCFVGDLIDRGPCSSEVVDFIIQCKYDCVMGNHEDMMIKYKTGDRYSDYIWMSNGGDTTLKSYKGNIDLFLEHKLWMSTLPLLLKYDNIKNDKGEKLVVSHSIAHAPMRRHRS